MPTLMRYWWFPAILLFGLFFVSGINTIPALDQQVEEAWVQVDSQYQQRLTLVPNLLAAVKDYANYEKAALADVADAHAKAMQISLSPDMLGNVEAVRNYEKAQFDLDTALSRLMGVCENYSGLKTDRAFLGVQSQLQSVDGRIADARREYISAVRHYNIEVRTFPGAIWAMISKAKPKVELMSIESADKPLPTVKF